MIFGESVYLKRSRETCGMIVVRCDIKCEMKGPRQKSNECSGSQKNGLRYLQQWRPFFAGHKKTPQNLPQN